MKFIISRKSLLPVLQNICGLVERRPSKTILTYLLLELTPEKISVTTSDTELEMTATLNEKVNASGSITLPARKLLDVCRVLPEDADINLDIEGTRAVISSGRSRFTLMTQPAEEFPKVKAGGDVENRFTVSQAALKSLLEKTSFAMANQDVRYYLNGLLLETKTDTLRAVATDGHRMALNDIDMDLSAVGENQLIIPRKAVQELLRLIPDEDGDLEIQLYKTHIRVIMENLTVTSKLIDGKFPDYAGVIPEPCETPVQAAREPLRQGLSRAAILIMEDKQRGVRITLENNRMLAVVQNQEQEEAQEEMDIEYAGEKLQVGFNATYLLDAINTIETEKVRLSISSPKSGCLVLPEDGERSKYIVMPLLL